jgi:multisubunit Na+/H+ antiporter MnhF subunit
MNEWLVAALVLIVLLVICGAVAALTDLLSGLIALELSGVVAITALLVLAEAMRRESFVDLALVATFLSLPGALMFVRVLERRV